jgi:uncharacterized protein (TIGR02391 family)
MFKPNYQKVLKAHIDLIHTQVSDVTKQLLDLTMKINTEMLMKRRYDEARGYSSIICQQVSLFRRTIESYFAQSIKKLLETGADFSFSLDDIQKEKIAVFCWFDDICKQTKNFQEELKSNNDEKIFKSFWSLQGKIGYDERLTDFVNTLITLQTEHVMYQIKENQDELATLFNDLRLHQIVKNASEELFKNGHYAQAIFESCKALIEHVRRKSKLKVTNDMELMWQAFGVKYSRNPLRITRGPALRLNSLNEMWEIDEQQGFANIFSGTITGIRNPKAHADIIQKDPYKTLEYLSLISLLAKRTDEAAKTESF